MFLQYQSTSNWTPQGEIESFKFADDMYYLLLNLWHFLLSLWVTHPFLQLYLLLENMITLWHTCFKKFSKNSKKNICDRCFSKNFQNSFLKEHCWRFWFRLIMIILQQFPEHQVVAKGYTYLSRPHPLQLRLTGLLIHVYPFVTKVQWNSCSVSFGQHSAFSAQLHAHNYGEDMLLHWRFSRGSPKIAPSQYTFRLLFLLLLLYFIVLYSLYLWSITILVTYNN